MSKRTGGRRLLVLIAALASAAAIAAGAYFLITQVFDDSEPAPAPAPQAVIEQVEPEDTDVTDLGFPAFATKNTTRVAGPDPIFDAAGVALAVYPSTGGVEGPAAVSLVDAADWQSGIAAASLMAAPIGAPVLLTDGGEVPPPTESALGALAPAGSKATDGAQAFRIGEAADPGALDTTEVGSGDPAEIAAGIDRLRSRLTKSEPEHLLLVSSEEPAFAMPAAAWAARSGDPVLFLERRRGAEADPRRPPAPQGRPGLRPRARAGGLQARLRRGRQGLAGRASGSPAPTRSRTRSSSPATPPATSAGTSTTPGMDSSSPTPTGPPTPPRRRRSRPAAPGGRCC